jgi:hypothetical protein
MSTPISLSIFATLVRLVMTPMDPTPAVSLTTTSSQVDAMP